MRVAIRTLALSVAAALFCSITQSICAQGIDPMAAIQQKLQERIVLATLDANGEIVTAGSVITLRSGSLQMCATTAPAAAGTPVNSYKNGRLSAGMFSWNLGLGLMKIDPNSIPMHTAVAGEKFWIVHYNVMKNNVQFKIWTDPDSNNLRYWTWLEIPFDKKQVPSPDQFMNTLAEVLALEPQENQSGQLGQAQKDSGPSAPVSNNSDRKASATQAVGMYLRRGKSSDFIEIRTDGQWFLHQGRVQVGGSYTVQGDTITLVCPRLRRQETDLFTGDLIKDHDGIIWEKQAQPASAPAALAPAVQETLLPPPAPHQYEDVAPPPPPPAPAPTISMGQTKDQVTASFGEPQRKAAAGAKEIFFYTDLKMKVTFTNGKVSSIE
jgi:hypothetical protein